MKLCNMRFENIKIWEAVRQSKKSHNERVLLQNLGESTLVNNLLEYLYTAKKRSSEFGRLRAKMVKYFFIFHKFIMKKLYM